MFRNERTNSSKDDGLTVESSTSVNRVPENVTSNYVESSPITRRSDSYYSLLNFGPSTVLLPPLPFPETTQKYYDTSYSQQSKTTEKPVYTESARGRDGGRSHFDPPKNGGALAKTFNSFDSLLSSFIAAVTSPKSLTSTTVETTTSTPPPQLLNSQREKSIPETIVRSEIGTIRHDPIIITENFSIRQPVIIENNNGGEKTNAVTPKVVASLPPPSSTHVPPPKLSQNDYLAYFVEIEPKKPKNIESGRGGFYLNVPLETDEQSRPNGRRIPGNRQSNNQGNFERQQQTGFGRGGTNQRSRFNSELTTNGNQKEDDNISSSIEKQTIIGPFGTNNQPYKPVGKWVIAKNQEKPARLSTTPQPTPFDAYIQKKQEKEILLEPQTSPQQPQIITQRVVPEPIERKQISQGPVPARTEENYLQNRPISSSTEEVPPPTESVSSSPYKFLYVNIDRKKDFGRNGGERNKDESEERIKYKTKPENNRGRGRLPFPEEESTESVVPFVQNYKKNENDEVGKFIYKTDSRPEIRIRDNVAEDNRSRKSEISSVITPKIIVPEIKPQTEEEETIASLNIKPIQVLPEVEKEEGERGENNAAKEEDLEQNQKKRRKQNQQQHRVKSSDVEETSPSSTETINKKYGNGYQNSDESSPEDNRRQQPQQPRRLVKINRNDSKNQRLQPLQKKRTRKPSSAKLPIVVLEELEEKKFSKENEIQPTYRPIIVSDLPYPPTLTKNKTRFRFTVENEKDFSNVDNNNNNNKISPPSNLTTEKNNKSQQTDTENDLPPPENKNNNNNDYSSNNSNSNDSDNNDNDDDNKPLIPKLKRPNQTVKNVTQLFENRATTTTTKAYRGKFKPSDIKLR